MCSYIHFTQSHGRKSVSHLPDPDHSIGDEDEKNNNRLNKGGGCFLSLLKQSQHLDEHTGHVTLADILYCNSRSPTVALSYTFSGTVAHVWEEKCLNIVAGNCREGKPTSMIPGPRSCCCLMYPQYFNHLHITFFPLHFLIIYPFSHY